MKTSCFLRREEGARLDIVRMPEASRSIRRIQTESHGVTSPEKEPTKRLVRCECELPKWRCSDAPDDDDESTDPFLGRIEIA